MNGKKSRALRKTALELTQGQPMVAYEGGDEPYMALNKQTGLPFRVPGVPLKLVPNCTRYLYQRTKRMLAKNQVVA